MYNICTCACLISRNYSPPTQHMHESNDCQTRRKSFLTKEGIMSASGAKILVTGGNAGVGFALCKQLAVEHGCHVYLASRSSQRGSEAVASIQSMLKEKGDGFVELLTLDVGDDASVSKAAETLKSKLNGELLYGIVNNAGLGPKCDSADEIMNVNFYGPKRVIDAFGNCLKSDGGRVVNVGSGAGPSYVKNCPPDMQRLLCSEPASFDQIASWATKSSDGKTGIGSEADG